MLRRFDLRVATISLGAAVCIAAVALPAKLTFKPLTKKPTVDFNRDVRPIFAQHCWVCHGADKDALAKTGNMKLDTFEGATADRGGYRAISPGQPDKSVLLQRVSATDAAMRMPPSASGIKPLTPDEIATLRKWIEEGAEYRPHWAFVPPKMPPISSVTDKLWPKNDIDRFILSKLEESGIKPEAEADKRTLIRRVTLTLTGLPPTPDQVESFVQDRSINAYDKLVDRLLDDPHFGENQARYWLDAVRYADTHGLHIDNERAIYPYRDWVVRAYNEDLPYDQFVKWQLAGDLLPNPSTEQMIATGYIRLNPTTNEGGAIEAEFLAKNTMDRVDTTATVLLGLTLQCAKCHDHKYDPLSQKDYYSMFAFFDSTKDAPLDGNLNAPPPAMKAPTPEQEKQLAAVNVKLSGLVTKANVNSAHLWALEQIRRIPEASDWQVSDQYLAATFDAAFDTHFAPEPDAHSFGKVVWKPFDAALDKPLAGIASAQNSAGYLRATITAGKAEHVDLMVGSDDGVKVWLNGKLVHANKVLRPLGEQDRVPVDLVEGKNELVVKIVNAGGGDGAYVGFGGTQLQRISRAYALTSKPNLTTEEQADIVRAYLDYGSDEPIGAEYRRLESQRDVLDAQIPMTLIAQDMMQPRPTFILKRGQYDLPGAPVSRAIPSVFGTLPANARKNRLGLADWIVDPKNPLTSRVMVNRVWQQHFGAGLVKSSEDFGSRGELPTNPELLDYLACKFVQEGWSIKKLTRMIVTSATFRQAATADKAKRQKDPENVLLSRGPRFRLDAEVIRDSALDESGLLADKMGGHDDKPYQPPGLWEIIAYPISDTAHYKQDHGDALYRRSMYLFWKRTSPPPVMMLLDAPMRESCVVRRSRTNTPTQALATMNETGFFEDARAMAQRLIRRGGSDQQKIDYAYRLATGRAPTAGESKIVLAFLNEQRARYRSNPTEAVKTLSIGESPRDRSIPAPEHAAWALVCNMVLNLDEALTQH